jgi:hypothetical protein
MSTLSQFGIDRSYPGTWTITFDIPPIDMFTPATCPEHPHWKAIGQIRRAGTSKRNRPPRAAMASEDIRCRAAI